MSHKYSHFPYTDFPYIDDFCDDEVYVFSTMGKGPSGEVGNPGPQGPQGEKGEKGDKGDKGDTEPNIVVVSHYRDKYDDDDDLFDSCLNIAAENNGILYVDIALTFDKRHPLNMANLSYYPSRIIFNRNVEQVINTPVCFELYTDPMTVYHSIHISGINARSISEHANTLFYMHGVTTVYIDHFDIKDFDKAFHLRNTRSGEWTEINHFEAGHIANCVYSFYLDKANDADTSFHGNTFDCYVEAPKNIENAILYIGRDAVLYNANVKITAWSRCDSDVLTNIIETHGRIVGCNLELYNENLGMNRVTTQFGGKGSYGCIYVGNDATRNLVSGFSAVSGGPNFLPVIYEEGNTTWAPYLTFNIETINSSAQREIYLDDKSLYLGQSINVGTTGQLQLYNGWDENGDTIYVPIVKDNTLFVNKMDFIHLSIGRWGGYDQRQMRIGEFFGSPYNHFKAYGSFNNQERVLEGTFSIDNNGVFTLNSCTDDVSPILCMECVRNYSI